MDMFDICGWYFTDVSVHWLLLPHPVVGQVLCERVHAYLNECSRGSNTKKRTRSQVADHWARRPRPPVHRLTRNQVLHYSIYIQLSTAQNKLAVSPAICTNWIEFLTPINLRQFELLLAICQRQTRRQLRIVCFPQKAFRFNVSFWWFIGNWPVLFLFFLFNLRHTFKSEITIFVCFYFRQLHLQIAIRISLLLIFNAEGGDLNREIRVHACSQNNHDSVLFVSWFTCIGIHQMNGKRAAKFFLLKHCT